MSSQNRNAFRTRINCSFNPNYLSVEFNLRDTSLLLLPHYMHAVPSFRLAVIVPLSIMPTLFGKASYLLFDISAWGKYNIVTMGEQPFYLTGKVG